MSYSDGAELQHRRVTLDQALARVYRPKRYGSRCSVCIPLVLEGRRFKIRLLEDEEM